MVAGDDVSNGKPAPDCFLLAAERLGQSPADCLVFEDAPAGIRAAEAAGMGVVVITALHSHPFEPSHPTLASYDDVSALIGESGMLALSRSLRRTAALGA